MEIALIADDSRKELLAEFCIAYSGILSRHNLSATQATGRYITEASGLQIDLMLAGHDGGAEQIASRISFDEIDILLYFPGHSPESGISQSLGHLIRLCDVHNVPVATNLATAEVLIMALDEGKLEWREYINARAAKQEKKK